MCLTLHKIEGLCKKSRFLEIADILLGHSLLMAQFLEYMIIFLFREFFLLNIRYDKSLTMRSRCRARIRNMLADRVRESVPP
jgi:hypothetical protein